MKKKLLILGSDYGTIDIVHEAHRMGLYVIVTDLMEISPTKQAADESWLISTTEIEILEKKCREEHVDGILTGASDFNIRQSRILCKRLGLPVYCDNDNAWEVSTNKRKFKDLCKKIGAPIAEDYHLSDELSRNDLAKIHYPVVVKPVDKSGNRGMSYCANEEELIKAYKYARSVSENSNIIVERELHGPEYAVNYLMVDGDIRLYFFSSEHNQPGELDNLYSVIITTSQYLQQYINEVNQKVIDVFREAGCRNGVAWVECIRDTDGHFYLLEMGYRFGGEMVNVPYQYVSGFNSIRFMIDLAMGKKVTKEDMPHKLDAAYNKCAATYLLFATHDGVIRNISGLDVIRKYPNVLLDMPKREGGVVRYHATMGVVHISADNIEELCGTIEKVNQNLKVTDEEGKDMFIYYDDFDSLRHEYNAGLKEFENEVSR